MGSLRSSSIGERRAWEIILATTSVGQLRSDSESGFKAGFRGHKLHCTPGFHVGYRITVAEHKGQLRRHEGQLPSCKAGKAALACTNTTPVTPHWVRSCIRRRLHLRDRTSGLVRRAEEALPTIGQSWRQLKLTDRTRSHCVCLCVSNVGPCSVSAKCLGQGSSRLQRSELDNRSEPIGSAHSYHRDTC